MAPRSIASLSISFGLVSIPVKLFSATESKSGVSFNLMHKGCGTRLKQQYICPTHQSVVERTDMVKGYEFEKDKYVLFEPAELEALEAGAQHTIDIVSFMPADAIDPLFFDKAYFLAPDKRGGKPYQLLAQAMMDTGTCALARWVWKGQQHMAQLRATEEGVVLQQLLYADEVRSMAGLEIERPEVKPSELALAEQLIAQYRVEGYDAASYADEEKVRILAAIDRKIEGEQITAAPEMQQSGGEVIDLVEALRASLQRRKGKAAQPAAESPAPKLRKAAKRAPVVEVEEAPAALRRRAVRK
ncbi:Ku protein [Pararobbsia alpina]|uniref:Non-homologous end joining protein Ku n=1 Tax=Pararobbsia alpina TaxID=621374 RepID=A0A6S7BEZ7_9BURK|nr:Ku protein [Pararobbsia alpina]CAB3797918.1 Non-homologous end joining protein Ku [Pararobbsia alpina]